MDAKEIAGILKGAPSEVEVRFTDPSKLVSKSRRGISTDHRFVVPICHIAEVPVYGPFHDQDGNQYCTFWEPPDFGGIKVSLPRENMLDDYRA